MSKWTKGMPSPNPGGRTKAQQAFGKLFRDQTHDGADLAALILRVAFGNEQNMTDEKSRRWAIQLAAAYGFGKPTEHVEVSTGDGATMPDMRGKTLEELRELAGRGRRAPERAGDPPDSVH